MNKVICGILLTLFIGISVSADISTVKKLPYDQVGGRGPLPYNYRIIDGHTHAGGHPLGPRNNFGNTDEQAMGILRYLKGQGVTVIIDLENTHWIQTRYQRLIDAVGLQRLHVPMNISRVPNASEWAKIKEALKGNAYVHCKWGADRTGAVIGRYLVEEKGYTTREAYNAVIYGGSHAGPRGGLKEGILYQRLKDFIR